MGPFSLAKNIEFHFDILKKEKSLKLLQILKEAGFEITTATIERWIVGARQHKTLGNIVSFLERKCGVPPYGYVSLSIDEIMSSEAILDGDWGALEICFKRLQQEARERIA